MTMNSITKCSPVFNVKTGMISYTWDDLMQEKPLCPRCNNSMGFWYTRKRGVIISEQKYVFMAPRFKCTCGCTMTMRPYFIALRKQYSIFSIEEILNADASDDHSVAAAYGSSRLAALRKWAVELVRSLLSNPREFSYLDDRSIIRALHQHNGRYWLSSLVQNMSGSAHFPLYPFSSG